MFGHMNDFVTKSGLVECAYVPKGENDRKKKARNNRMYQKFDYPFESGSFFQKSINQLRRESEQD